MLVKKVKHVSEWSFGQEYYLADIGDVLSIYSVHAAPLLAAGVVVEATDKESDVNFNASPDWPARANPHSDNQFYLKP